jgi:HlyD family secretion protein
MKKILIAVLVLVFLGGSGAFGYWYVRGASRADGAFRTEAATRGDLLATISATGTLEPTDVVDVGAQVAGLITKFGNDENGKLVDYGSKVKPGMTLAQIDDSLYQAQVAQSKAMVDQNIAKVAEAKAKYDQCVAQIDEAKANVQRSQADVESSKAKYDQAKRDWDRAVSLKPTGGLAQADFDAYESAYLASKAALALSNAALVQAKAAVIDATANAANAQATIGDAEAAVDNAKAMLKKDEINLGYTTIKSPVQGVIIDRRVTIGQTVQSSFNTPSLFLLALDMTKMKVWASVNEADIGRVHKGQTVRFTVDAFPGEVFTGTVGLIRLNATMTNNVVTYTVEVVTDNTGEKLLPYLTANLKFEVADRKDVLLVSNEALRWKPTPSQIAPDARKPQGGRGQGRGDGEKGKGDKPSGESANQGTVWIKDGQYVRPVKVKLGLSDGTKTEIVGGELEEGATVVTGDAPQGGSDSGATNPFIPQMFGTKKS